MIFVCSEKSKQLYATDFFSNLYDGTEKEYPNGIMMLFIPLNPNIMYEPSYHQKVIFNHEQYLGEETCMCIHGLQDRNTRVKLRDSQEVSLRMLLRSLPESQGMSRPQLFQLVEPNPAGAVVVVTFQQCDREYVLNHRMFLESDIRAQIAKGAGCKVFQSEVAGMWFNEVHRSRNSRLALGKQSSKSDLEHIEHTHRILSSPPPRKKRAYNPGKWNPKPTAITQGCNTHHKGATSSDCFFAFPQP